MRRRTLAHPGLVYFFADLLAITAAYYCTLWLRFHPVWGETLFTWINRALEIRETGEVGASFKTFYIVSAPRLILFLTVTLTLLYALRDLYGERRFIRPRPVVWNVLVCTGYALVFFYVYFYLSRNTFHPRSMFATMLVMNAGFCIGLRALTERLLRRARLRQGFDVFITVLVGRNRHAAEIASMITAAPSCSLKLAEQLDADPAEPFEALLTRIRDAVARHGAQVVVLADPRFTFSQLMRFLEMADALDIAVKVLSRELDLIVTRAQIEGDLVHGIPLVHFAAPSRAHRFHEIKRLASLVVAAGLTVALTPLMLLLALLIRLTSPGPALFVQERIGINRRPFRMYKFRTMVVRADEQLAALESANDAGPGLFKLRRDPRVTRVGQFLRQYSLDELPQLFNVLRGEMTLVGPRPLPRRDFENYYAEWHYGRHDGLPGLTCLWQVSGRSDLDFHNMCILDVYYLRNQDWVLDLKILVRTAWVVLFARGAY